MKKAGFTVQRVEREGRQNFWAEFGTRGLLFAFSGHTDVVPPGEESAWSYPPFEPTIFEGKLYGRGAQDMKGQVAAFVTAAERFLVRNPDPNFSLGLLIAGDEEHDYNFGTEVLLDHLQERGRRIDLCLVGEPTSTSLVGDTIKIGRRGSYTGQLKIFGKQGHAAHPHKAINAISRGLPVLKELAELEWDGGNSHFGPSTFQITNVHSGSGAANIIPGVLQATFNIRYSNELTPEFIEAKIYEVLNRHGVLYEISWIHGASPFLTEHGDFVDLVSHTIEETLGIKPELSTSGGTSDARFIAARGIKVVELGMTNDTIHQVDECASIEDLQKISLVYEKIMERLNMERLNAG